MRIPERYFIAGLDALCRSHQQASWHFQGMLDAHRGAAVLSAWFMFQDGTIEDAAAEPLLDLIEREYLPTAVFAPYPTAAASESDLRALLAQMETTVRHSGHMGHNAIFASLALKALHAEPRLATPERIAGLARLAGAYRNDPQPGEHLPDQPHAQGAWSAQVLRALFPAMAAHGLGVFGHLLTYGRAVDDLEQAGHHHLARMAKAGWSEYALEAARPGVYTSFPPRTAPPPVDGQLPNGRRYWQSRPVRYLEMGHRLKYAYAFFGHLARCDDPEVARRGWAVAGEFADTNPQPLSDWWGDWRTSGVLPGEGIAAMARPAPSDAGPLEQRAFDAFVDCHDRWEGRSGHAVFFGGISCPEAMELELRIGYDGPIRLWLDDQELLADFHGTNPAIQDRERRAVRVAAGEHRLTLLMALNGGKACGFFLRWARLGLSEAELDRARFAMPRISGSEARQA